METSTRNTTIGAGVGIVAGAIGGLGADKLIKKDFVHNIQKSHIADRVARDVLEISGEKKDIKNTILDAVKGAFKVGEGHEDLMKKIAENTKANEKFTKLNGICKKANYIAIGATALAVTGAIIGKIIAKHNNKVANK